ncbi:insulinase family protein [Dactylosporangium sp. NPDC005572]|uniref:insulinase family protein n=1 Tax=Dactylosporangium sp. NPDC005572 TaxID=3156889 RepID=UPI0033B96254
MRRLEVDGVPALYAPYDGPMIAGLTFRVGQVDEALPYRGITHLLEHLVLHRHGLTDYHYNGATGAISTTFTLQGGEDDITAYLTGVCDSLLDPPLDRLETERTILRAEAAGRGMSVNELMPLWRYGARDYGLVSYEEMGLPRITGEHLHRWAANWFTRQNAVLWVAGRRMPPGLRLRLRDGVRQPVPPPSSALPRTPAWFTGPGTHVVFDGIVRRGTPGSVLAGVLERELFRTLRQEDGNSYTATASYAPRGDGFAAVTAFADAAPGKHDAVLGGFVDVLAKLRVGRIERADVDAVRAKADDALTGPMAAVGRLPSQALNLLLSEPVRDVEQVREELHAVTVADVHRTALAALDSGLLQVPGDLDAEWAGYAAAPTSSTVVVAGPRYGRLIVGADGVSLQHDDAAATVLYRECAVCLAYPDGGRQLIGHDSITVRVEPTMHPVPPDLLRQIDATLARVTVWLPARDPRSIPQPAPAEHPPLPAPAGPNTLVGGIVLVVLSVVALCCGATWTWAVADNSDPESDVPFDAVSGTINGILYAAGLVMLVIGIRLLLRRRAK